MLDVEVSPIKTLSHNSRTRMITNELATNSSDLAGFLTTVRGRKVSLFGKRGIAGTLEEAVFRLVLYIAKRWGLGSKVGECIFGA